MWNVLSLEVYLVSIKIYRRRLEFSLTICIIASSFIEFLFTRDLVGLLSTLSSSASDPLHEWDRLNGSIVQTLVKCDLSGFKSSMYIAFMLKLYVPWILRKHPTTRVARRCIGQKWMTFFIFGLFWMQKKKIVKNISLSWFSRDFRKLWLISARLIDPSLSLYSFSYYV